MSRRVVAILAAALLAVASAIAPGPMYCLALAKPVRSAPKPAAPPPPPPNPSQSAPATPGSSPDARPYDPQLMRLSEILGALTYLRGVCGEKDAAQWRARMQTLLDAEGSPPARKDRLAGAYNRGVTCYSLSYRTCTPNARLVIARFLDEGERIAKELGNRYRAS